MIRAVLFDLDGTLLDTPRLITEVIAAVLAHCGAAPQTEAHIRATIGLRLNDAFGTLMGVTPDDVAVLEAIARYRKLFTQLVLPKGRQLLYPGVAKGLELLHDRGTALAVATSKASASAHEILTAAGLHDAFDLVIGADQVDHPKPHPEMAHRVLRVLGYEPTQAVMVGDTTHDVGMARQAGLPSIAVTYGVHSTRQLKESRPTWLAASFPEAIAHILAAGRARS